MRTIAFVLGAACLSCCATHPSQIPAAYVSPLTYGHLTCQQVSGEMDRVKLREVQVAAAQGNKANSDALWVGTAVLFMPVSLIMLGSGSNQAGELARLRGEWDALYANYREKECAVEDPSRLILPPS